MLDAYQVEVIAAMGDGFVVHARPHCIPEWDAIQELTDADDGFIPDYRRFWDIAENQYGYRPMVRFSIHEWESSNLGDAIFNGDVDEDDDDYDGPLAWVHCDTCEERIE